MTVTWTGELSVNGGAWQPVSDVGNTVSQPRNVTILEAHAVLTDPYNRPCRSTSHHSAYPASGVRPGPPPDLAAEGGDGLGGREDGECGEQHRGAAADQPNR